MKVLFVVFLLSVTLDPTGGHGFHPWIFMQPKQSKPVETTKMPMETTTKDLNGKTGNDEKALKELLNCFETSYFWTLLWNPELCDATVLKLKLFKALKSLKNFRQRSQ